jgi:hypothetical protein
MEAIPTPFMSPNHASLMAIKVLFGTSVLFSRVEIDNAIIGIKYFLFRDLMATAPRQPAADIKELAARNGARKEIAEIDKIF